MIEAYRQQAAERAQQGIPPLPLTAEQTSELCELLKNPPSGEKEFLMELLRDRIPPGVDEAAYVKAGFLTAIAKREISSPLICPQGAIDLLGTMVGGYNVQSLVSFLKSSDSNIASEAANALSKITLVFDAFNDILALSDINPYAKQVLDAWANAAWFIRNPKVPKAITVTVFKVPGETNTDDLSPAPHATTRPDIPLHALAMLESRMPEGIQTIAQLKQKGYPVAYVGDVVGTGSSRKSAINSVLWHIGEDIPFVPNKRRGGYILGGKIAPIFFNTAEDSGAFPIECDVSKIETGDVITIHPYKGEITNEAGEVISTFTLKPETILDEVRAGGRIPLLIGRSLTDKTREAMGLTPSELFARPAMPEDTGVGFTLAQKMVGKACGLPGVRPGTSCEPIMTTVGSQDTTGPMTRDELKELACLGFSADLTMQSFCHTAAYPKPVDIKTHKQLPDFFATRGGVALRPGDGIIHSWLNRMLLPDTVGTGGDSHTRFPLGISFPAGSGLVAFAAALGAMPLDMPESVLVRFKGQLQPGVTLRDIVNAIPWVAMQQGKLTTGKENKQNVFNGRIMEMEGLPDLKVEQAFELTDATAERSCAGCTIKLGTETISEYLRSNVALMRNMIARGYQDARTLTRRIAKMEQWLANPELMEADPDAEYADILEVNLDEIVEPIVAAPNDPDNVKLMSECAGDKIDEVFIGSCMTNIGHYRAAAKVLEGAGPVKVRLWICPPTRMDEQQLREEGVYGTFAAAGARTEMPGCSLCMGNQARVEDNTTVFSTSTRNFNNRMGKGAQVYLGSAELAAVCALLGRIPTVEEYMEIITQKIDPFAGDLYRYLNFDQIAGFEDEGRVIPIEQMPKIEDVLGIPAGALSN
ncbi:MULTISPECIES: bifunctional aconitate hydratase 2/2-methylisocitrate dehydratase [Arthrospira]|jgi:aconitate hydratase 2/2-methylisocitrate dehydratase|uniref:Aconitate hydratase B n=1 Tax=Limnospira platensis NIES-46 TaxID=1236695 RepID=A0A5M3T4N3_LIMPL|nr:MULTISPECIES: bifunctional aconitate hydratase 2/2-methylisocitrate dehydratase [Arthrospira]AMW27609.1 aconitate hydratase [Arthrospira platensis YZ]KDR57765.1 aconitate hydratase 2 [Arthrospira platensis str. Paraca]MBD2668887.1 bifunctional aconitate hydratase 2/2-methylisocitrate dehydratase [Arthrospira platensis FACHB-439]MBD2709324.1 bifunctional aconitate hydratase 2/2-methylisocitrate dehydratase [Arthrospira platensis FACHB-835]MDF2209944.1 bifunctional aconitate hydratase 2/2-met